MRVHLLGGAGGEDKRRRRGGEEKRRRRGGEEKRKRRGGEEKREGRREKGGGRGSEEKREGKRGRRENWSPVLTWQRRGFRVRSSAAVASTSLPVVRDRSVGVKRGQNPNIGVEAAVSKHWGEKRTNPKHWGFPDYEEEKKSMDEKWREKKDNIIYLHE